MATLGYQPQSNHLPIAIAYYVPESLAPLGRPYRIEKHITWHCARHSCCTNLLSNGANIKTVASNLGHSNLAHTEKYTRGVDSLKQAAMTPCRH